MSTPDRPVSSKEEALKRQLLTDLVNYRDHLNSEVGAVTVKTRGATAGLTTQLSLEDQTPWLHGDQIFTAALSVLQAIQKPDEVVTGIPLVRFRAPIRSDMNLFAQDRALREPSATAPFIATFQTSEGRTLDVTASPRKERITKRGSMVLPPLLKYVTSLSTQPLSVLPPLPGEMKELLGADLERCMLGFWYAFLTGNSFVPFAALGEASADTMLHSLKDCVIPPFDPLTEASSTFKGSLGVPAQPSQKGLLKATGHTELRQGGNKVGEGDASFVFLNPEQMRTIRKSTIGR